jgi:hypothetical protein
VIDQTLPIQSPLWWVKRLHAALKCQAEKAEFFNNYYTGDHPLPWMRPKARDEFRKLVEMTRSNYMGLVCDATAERASVEGFRFGSGGAADEDTWRIWQANNLDSDSDLAWLESLIGGVSFFCVAPNPKDSKTPLVWVEHASQAIVAHVPGTNRRETAAGLKMWTDDWTGEIHSTLFLPDWIYKFKAPADGLETPDGLQWSEREVTGEQPNGQRPNPMHEVPLVEVPNNPRLLGGGVSELYDLTDIQDRINLTLFHRIQTQEYGADPQKWATGYPDEDEDGVAQTVEFGRNRMVSTDVVETRFGQWQSALLNPYSDSKREDVKDIASRSRTPAQYLLGEMSNVNGETLKASESGLVSKVKQRRRPWGEAAESTMRKARKIAGLPDQGDARMETIWTNPQFRTEGELTDAVIKRVNAKITPMRQAREDLGYTATQIKQMEEEDKANPPAPPPAPPGPPGAPPGAPQPPGAPSPEPPAVPPAA